MTINLTDPANHPANGKLPVQRIERIIEALESSLAYRNGSSMDHFIADAVKGLRELRVSRETEPVAWMYDGEDGREYNGHNEFSGGGKGVPLYAAPPFPVNPDCWIPVSERMPEEGVKVFVYDSGMNAFICYHRCGFWRDFRVGESRHEPTHWMRLPEPPVK